MTNTTYNGWTNRATWNVALWINGDKGLYDFAHNFSNYADFVDGLKETNEGTAISFKTPDGVSWTDSALNHEELNQIFEEFMNKNLDA